ncbi:MAG: HEPN domain-containing protein [Conexivisphaera sp.]
MPDLERALRDFRAARSSAADGDYAMACVAAQQAASEALEELIRAVGGTGGRGTLGELLEALGGRFDTSPLRRAAADLDRCYGLHREDDGQGSGAMDAARALARAEQIMLWVRERLAEVRMGRS